MYRQIIIAAFLLSTIMACTKKTQNNYVGDDEPIAMENSACLNYPEPAQFLPKAEQGDFKAMRTAHHYYEYCGFDNINLKKQLYWAKRLADTGDTYHKDNEYEAGYNYMVTLAAVTVDQTNPANKDPDPELNLDPLLYWVWAKKACEFAKKHPWVVVEDNCTPLPPLGWMTQAQWKKTIISPPTVKDKDWYQFLPKGCENGECLPK